MNSVRSNLFSNFLKYQRFLPSLNVWKSNLRLSLTKIIFEKSFFSEIVLPTLPTIVPTYLSTNDEISNQGLLIILSSLDIGIITLNI